MILQFEVISSDTEPFKTEFWREGNNLYSKCTCPTSKKYSFCNHAISLIFGNFTTLVSRNPEDIGQLKTMVAGSDYDELFKLIRKSFQAINLINERLLLVVKKEGRKTIGLIDAYKIFKDNGFGKGNGGANFLDVYDKDNIYAGSFKLQSNIFENELEKAFYNIPIKTIEKVDNLLYKGSTSYYYFLVNSTLDKLVQEEQKMDEYKEKLKKV
jgi:hypothetical protein